VNYQVIALTAVALLAAPAFAEAPQAVPAPPAIAATPSAPPHVYPAHEVNLAAVLTSFDGKPIPDPLQCKETPGEPADPGDLKATPPRAAKPAVPPSSDCTDAGPLVLARVIAMAECSQNEDDRPTQKMLQPEQTSIVVRASMRCAHGMALTDPVLNQNALTAITAATKALPPRVVPPIMITLSSQDISDILMRDYLVNWASIVLARVTPMITGEKP
jgi:hypothetical protein